MVTTEEIIREAEKLPPLERVRIVDSILKTLNPSDAETDRLWIKEAIRRRDEMRSGQVQAIPEEEVFAKVARRFNS
ncbi:addiction module protein [Candidatus Sumerlaeota bacterium]|nr:addiction module protein [Candidatus Sumerlaeota bacterium]